MTGKHRRLANRILGYPDDARLLILNADDFGFCNSINEAVMRLLLRGPVRATSLMLPCPWALHAVQFLQSHPEIPFGVHLTVISDPLVYRWGPFAPRRSVPSLVDEAGYFYNFDDMHARLPQVSLGELEVEFRAQIEAALALGLKPAHLDWHALRFGSRTDIFDLMVRLAKSYGLALRVIGRPRIEQLQSRGLPTIDNDFLDSYLLPPDAKRAQFARLLRELPAGLSEWAIHPGFANSELLAIEPEGAHYRQADFDFWSSPEASEILRAEGIILLDYRVLQAFWAQGAAGEQ